MKKASSLLIVLLIIFIAIVFIGKNLIAKTAITKGVKMVTGLQMDIGSMDVGILNTLVGINDIKLYNPPDYPERIMVDMQEIYVNYDLSAFLKRQAHLEEVRINLKELTVLKDKNGELNIKSLKIAKEEKKHKKSEKKKETEVKIDVLDLKIGKVVYKDFSRGREPKTTEYNLNLHEKYQNVTDFNEMGRLILVKALINTNIANLANFDLSPLKSGLSESFKEAAGTGRTLQEAGEKVTEAIEKATEDIQKKLKLPFGK